MQVDSTVGRHSHPVGLALSGLVRSTILFPGALRRAILFGACGAGTSICHLLVPHPIAIDLAT